MSKRFFIFAYDYVVKFYVGQGFDTYLDTASTLSKAVKKLKKYIDSISDNLRMMEDTEAYIVDMESMIPVVGFFINNGGFPEMSMKPAFQLELMFDIDAVEVTYIDRLGTIKFEPGVNGDVPVVAQWKVKDK